MDNIVSFKRHMPPSLHDFTAFIAVQGAPPAERLHLLLLCEVTREVIESYCCRWAIEVLFRALKQLLGFSSSRACSRLAVLRTAPWVGVYYTLLVLWYMELGLDTSQLGLPIRPWYRTMRTVAFSDILRLAQRTPSSSDWVDPLPLVANLRDSTPPPQLQAAWTAALSGKNGESRVRRIVRRG